MNSISRWDISIRHLGTLLMSRSGRRGALGVSQCPIGWSKTLSAESCARPLLRRYNATCRWKTKRSSKISSSWENSQRSVQKWVQNSIESSQTAQSSHTSSFSSLPETRRGRGLTMDTNKSFAERYAKGAAVYCSFMNLQILTVDTYGH